MCGRFTLKTTAESIKEMFLVEQGLHYDPSFNIAPSQPIVAIRYSPKNDMRAMSLMKWGLVPTWAKDPAIGYKLFNARAETLTEKPSYKGPFTYHRCLIPADGFYEWCRSADGKSKKQPYYIKRLDEKPMAFAGLWNYWCGPDGSELETCTIITTHANDIIKPIHDRMPVILKENEFDVWMDPRIQNTTLLKQYLNPYPSEEFEAYPVDTYVNKLANNSQECLKSLIA